MTSNTNTDIWIVSQIALHLTYRRMASAFFTTFRISADNLKFFSCNLKAGAFAAVSVDFLIYPLDTLKTRIQSPNYVTLYKNSATGALKPSLFRGLYQGVGSIVLATIPSC